MSNGLSSAISFSVSSSGNSSTRITTAPTCRFSLAGIDSRAWLAMASRSARLGARIFFSFSLMQLQGGGNGRKTDRRGTRQGAQGNQRLAQGDGPRRDQEEVSIPYLQRGLGLHVQGRRARQKDGPPSRMVQRLQQSRDHAVDPRRRRLVGPRYQAGSSDRQDRLGLKRRPCYVMIGGKE